MFHELTDNDIKRRRKRIVVTACLVAALALAALADNIMPSVVVTPR